LDGSIKNVLTAKAGDLKIQCVLCAALQPGEQLSFEIEAYMYTNLNGLSSVFTSTEIGITASTCIGPGSPLRVAFDTLGFPACKANLWAKYKPFIGEFDVGGSIPATHGMFLHAEFGMPVHDPVDAVMSYCNGQSLLQTSAADELQIADDSMPEMPFDDLMKIMAKQKQSKQSKQRKQSKQTCYNNFKSAAGNLEFGAGVTIPLIWGGDFWIVKVSGPHASGSKWKVDIFGIPLDLIAAAVKEVWENTIVPAFEDAAEAIDDAFSDVGDAFGSAASDVGGWTLGAAEDVGDWTSGAVDDIGDAWDSFW